MCKRIVSLLCALLLAFSLVAGAEPSILDFKQAQSGAGNWVENRLPDTMGKGGEWYAIALAQQGGYDLSACRGALESYVAGTKVRSATTRQKLALTLLALGSEHEFIAATLSDSIGKQGVMSWAWGLHLLNNGCESPEYTADEVVQTLLSLRKADGGWAITGDAADADATAMVLQALAPHREDAAVAAAIDEAVALLSRMQTKQGGFASYGIENAESAAQVIIALCALDVDPFTDERFIKNGANLLDALAAFRLADGSYAHEKGGASNENATAQVFLAEVAYARYQAGEGSLYLLDRNIAPGEMKTAWGWQVVAAGIIGGAAVLVCIVLLLVGKRHPKNFLAVAVIAAALIGGVFLLDVQTADDYYTVTSVKADAIGRVTLTIRCDKVAGRAAHIPQDGVILEATSLPVAAGDTVYTVLTDAARLHGIHMEASGANGLMYIHGIGNIYEFDFGDLSGWVYLVNGESASVGVDQYVLKDGDRVELCYTLELGKDLE
ncbi:MAG: DUF4430 domain-containing protein [Clostridia bacterium]|nr:DUF4430 domain-containing protein [Clostridia bacterium]